MAKIVCMTSGLRGIFNASLELMHRLEASGHEVVAASPEALQKSASDMGFKFLQLPPQQRDPAPSLPAMSKPFRKCKRWLHKVRHASARKDKAIDNLGMKRFAAMINDMQADLYLVDVELHEYIMTLHHNKCTYILLSQWFSLSKERGLPPIVSSIIPGQQWRGSQIGMWLAWQSLTLKRHWIFFKKRLLAAGVDRRSVLLSYARKCGFPLKNVSQNYWPGPFIYSGLPVMTMTMRELEFPYANKADLIYLGPMIFDQRDMHSKFQKRVSELKIRIDSARARGAKILYCSVSSVTSTDVNFIRRVIDSVSGKLEFELFISLGNNISSFNANETPQNVSVLNWVPQLFLLSESDLSINHGGIHTILECIHLKVPMLVYSGGRSDQDGCTARVSYHGIGSVGDRNKDSSTEIYRKIKRVLGDTNIQLRIAEYHNLAKEYRNEKVLEKTIANVLAKQFTSEREHLINLET